MKKSTVQSIILGSLILTTVAAGAWFIFYSETTQSPPLPQPVPEKTQQQEAPNNIPLEEDIPHSTSPDPHELPTESLSGETSEEITGDEPEQSDTSEEQEKAEAAASSESPESHISEQDESEEKALTDQPETTTSSQTDLPSSAKPSSEQKLLEEKTEDEKKQTQVIPSSGQQVDTKILSGPSCTEVSPKISEFFNQLEKKQYSTLPLQEHFNHLATQLVNNPPVVVNETNELYTLLTNTAHFFRILGKDNMELLQQVVKQEHRDFEKIAAEMYQLSLTGEECVTGKKKMEIPFTSAYEYAGFFLNTLGGRSYLFRREPGTRLLVNYYAVLTLDQANQKNLNIYGLDMTEYLPWLIQEMEASNRLNNKEGYLDKLYELSEKYQALP